MIEKITSLVKNNKKISDFHLRSGCDFSYREIGEIVIDNSTKVTEQNLEDLLKNHCSPQDVEKFKKQNETQRNVPKNRQGNCDLWLE